MICCTEAFTGLASYHTNLFQTWSRRPGGASARLRLTFELHLGPRRRDHEHRSGLVCQRDKGGSGPKVYRNT